MKWTVFYPEADFQGHTIPKFYSLELFSEVCKKPFFGLRRIFKTFFFQILYLWIVICFDVKLLQLFFHCLRKWCYTLLLIKHSNNHMVNVLYASCRPVSTETFFHLSHTFCRCLETLMSVYIMSIMILPKVRKQICKQT